MQRVKTNAAATGIVYWIRDQVIDVDQHRCKHREPCFKKIFSEEHSGYKSRQDQMQQQVYDGPEYRICQHVELGIKKAAQELGGSQAEGVSGPKSQLLN